MKCEENGSFRSKGEEKMGIFGGSVRKNVNFGSNFGGKMGFLG